MGCLGSNERGRPPNGPEGFPNASMVISVDPTGESRLIEFLGNFPGGIGNGSINFMTPSAVNVQSRLQTLPRGMP